MTYEYICAACGHGWEAEQSISEAPLRHCPSCNAEAAKRQVSGGAGFILKGGGWYADLYGSPKAPKSGGNGESKSDTKKDGGESKGSDTKPATSGSTSTPSAATGS
ncbi:MAG TPA: zinc ribbon domain-containing protein [Polyangiaceae bacterium]|nr:zinc ribbon domain-containing protein [Polyangiaceae bacterium]